MRKKRNFLEISMVQLDLNKMFSSIRFIPHVDHDWENTEITEFNFLLTKEMQEKLSRCNFALNNCQECNNYMPKRPVIKNKACDNRMPKLNMACVGMCTCNCMPFLARPENIQ